MSTIARMRLSPPKIHGAQVTADPTQAGVEEEAGVTTIWVCVDPTDPFVSVTFTPTKN
jgi:hypothetical protein